MHQLQQIKVQVNELKGKVGKDNSEIAELKEKVEKNKSEITELKEKVEKNNESQGVGERQQGFNAG